MVMAFFVQLSFFALDGTLISGKEQVLKILLFRLAISKSNCKLLLFLPFYLFACLVFCLCGLISLFDKAFT